MSDPRVEAIRKHPKVGRGSCASIDECYSDQELVDGLDEEGITDSQAAVRWALEREGLWLEQATNCRWGADNDPQLRELKRFKREISEISEINPLEGDEG